MADKIVKKLPGVLQTPAIKNFFESTVEQLYSKANTENVKGLIGDRTSDSYDQNNNTFIEELNTNRERYSLSPVVNTLNLTSGQSENFIYFDEFIDTLKIYGSDTLNQNKLFSTDYQTFLPPIDVDKLLNYQEYYWYPDGPSTIDVSGTIDNPIDVANDILGKESYTPNSGIAFRNGMIIQFVGEYVISESYVGTDYVVQGVGKGIKLVEKDQNFIVSYGTVELNAWDSTIFTLSNANIVHNAGNIASVIIENAGQGYVSPTVTFLGANTSPATATANANATTGAIEDVTVTASGSNYTTDIRVNISDVAVNTTIANAFPGGNSNVVVGNSWELTSTANVKVGQAITGAFTGTVTAVDSGNNIISVEDVKTVEGSSNLSLSFEGINFLATVRTDKFDLGGNGEIGINSASAIAGIDPNDSTNYYLQGGSYAWDADTDGDGNADLVWGGSITQSEKDYITLERGSVNRNVWSRVNFWYHKENFLDAGDTLPSKSKRAKRPILEYENDVELYNHGTTYRGTVDVCVTDFTFEEANGLPSSQLIDGVSIGNGTTMLFPNEQESITKHVWQASINTSTNIITLSKLPDPANLSNDFTFVDNDIIAVKAGERNIGREFYLKDSQLQEAQPKTKLNQCPLFNLYNDEGNYLGDTTKYPNTTFAGNKIFSFTDSTGTDDTEYGFPIAYRQFKSSSEISYTNFADKNVIKYTPVGSTSQSDIEGYYYFKKLGTTDSYSTLWKNSNSKSNQRIETKYILNLFDVDEKRLVYFAGGTPDVLSTATSGYDIIVKVNGLIKTNYTYSENYIKFNTFDLNEYDILEISIKSSTGLITDTSISKFNLPLSWSNNPFNKDISTISEPEYLNHFKGYMENQIGFAGDSLQNNNFDNTKKESKYADKIVKTKDDLIFGAFLLDDQNHNLLDSIRFCGNEYVKYKKRLLREINNFFDANDTSSFTNEFILESALRNAVTYSVGKDVFSQTYTLPFGDNYTEESITIGDPTVTSYTITNYLDISKLENSLLVYLDSGTSRTLLIPDTDFTYSSYNPITIATDSSLTLKTGDKLVFKLYDENRDSAQCPPTPSALGILHLHSPEKVSDTSFITAQDVIIGHDGSRHQTYGDSRDDIILEFEKRIYASAKKELREANSSPDYNLYQIRPGAFRTTELDRSDWADLLNLDFASYVKANKVNFVKNEFYDESDKWTYNYRGNNDLPGHWRGWYEYYYDTVRPHTNPWEMLGFTEKPTWWATQYGSDYSSANASLWSDLEQGIIRDGDRKNTDNDEYKTDNPYRRIGLSKVLPVDASANLITPNDITSTGSTTRSRVFTNASANTSLGYFTTSFLTNNGINVSFDGSNTYVQSKNINVFDDSRVDTTSELYPIVEQDLTYNVIRINLNTVTQANTQNTLGSVATGVTVDGIAINTPKGSSYNDEGVWHYNEGFNQTNYNNDIFAKTDANGKLSLVLPDSYGSVPFGNTTSHSGIIGWAFDGLPVYGPYGYTSYTSGGAILDGSITNIKSCFELRSGTRSSGPGGGFTGVFVEDYQVGANEGVDGFADRFNKRYGVTPDSPSTPIHFYVATVDDTGNPMFPYIIGGGVDNYSGNHSAVTWGNKYFSNTNEISNNTLGAGTLGSSLTNAITSTSTTSTVSTSDINNQWLFGDGAPVENAWKYSSSYPFAVAEALLLAGPGHFATTFADPTKLIKPTLDKKSYISSVTRKSWLFDNAKDFEIHGDVDSDGNLISNIGFTQFIYCWLKFQGLDIGSTFAEKLRTLNVKLGHRFAGFVDKDTLRLSMNQYSATGVSTNLIVPDNNITINIHNSPYKQRNMYSGIIIEKSAGDDMHHSTWSASEEYNKDDIVLYNNNYYQANQSVSVSSTFDKNKWTIINAIPKLNNGYTIRGYDTTLGYFNSIPSDKTKGSEKVFIGGDPADYSAWQPQQSYLKDDIVQKDNTFYIARVNVSGTDEFNAMLWRAISELPQVDPAEGVVYQFGQDKVEKIYYETEYTSVEDLFDALISIGRYQESLGFNFGDYDDEIGEARSWLYSAKQFLFWTTGSWQLGNTIELSPMASKVKFSTPLGFISQINRSERDQFTITDKNGVSISPKDCTILRESNTLEVIPPTGKEIYSLLCFTKEIEHAMVVDNTTDFADTIFDPVLQQRQSVFKLKTTRTANWSGKLLTEGFIVNNDELIPNLDNLAETMGRYHELGFIPVERQKYEKARGMFGYQERSYLNELDIIDDSQFTFYLGMIKDKGTKNSIGKISKSNAIVQGSMNVYDEWALKVGDFGDTLNDQAIELKLEKKDIVQDPQLVTLAFPEDTTGVVKEVFVNDNLYRFFKRPTLTFNNPATGSNVAQATANLDSNGLIANVIVTNPGSGYTYDEGARINVQAGELQTSNTSLDFKKATAISSTHITATIKDYLGNTLSTTGNIGSGSTANLIITDHFGNANVSFNLSAITDVANVVTLINESADVNANITASLIESSVTSNTSSTTSNVEIYKSIQIVGDDFSLSDSDANATLGNLNLTADRYQPTQRYGFDVANATTVNDVVVAIDGSVVANTNFTFDAGDVWEVTYPGATLTTGSYTVNIPGAGLVSGHTSIDAKNIVAVDGEYPFVEVLINDVALESSGGNPLYTVANATAITFPDISRLGSLVQNSKVTIIEKGTIEFDEAYQGDVPGKSLNITVSANDNLSAILELKRTFEITKDDKDDEVILFDIDDKTRFLKKPKGVREYNLWPSSNNVSSLGITDSKYNPLPNAGYVNFANVNYQSFDVPSIGNLFDNDIRFKPIANDHIHVAHSENSDWNVYKLKEASATINIVEQDDAMETAFLYSNVDFLSNSFIDSNQIGGTDNGRFLDYHLVIKNATLSDQFVIWTNQEVVDRKQIRLKNVQGVQMIEANIVSIGPSAGKILSIANIEAGASGATVATANIIGNSTVQITGDIGTLVNGDTVTFVDGQGVEYAYTTSSINHVTVTDTALLDTGNNVLSFTENDNYHVANVKFTGNSSVIDLNDLEQTVYAGNSNSTVQYINESNVTVPVSELSGTPTNVTLTRVHRDQIELEVSNINLHGSNRIAVNDMIELASSNSTYADSTWLVESVDSANSKVIIATEGLYDLSDETAGANISQLAITGFNLIDKSNLHGETYTISNVASTTFTVNDSTVDANVDAANLSFTYYGKTKITTSSDHNLYSGEVVKLIANAYSGYHFVESATANTFIVNVPYVASQPTTGNIILSGITITTDTDHGINAAYSGKRIAVHQADPRYYNQVFKVDSIDSSTTITVADAFSYADVANTMSNSVVTTIDHNRVVLNNSVISVDNIDSEEGFVEAFNRQQMLRRGFMDSDKMQLSIPMLKTFKPFKEPFGPMKNMRKLIPTSSGGPGQMVPGGPHNTIGTSPYLPTLPPGLTQTGSITIGGVALSGFVAGSLLHNPIMGKHNDVKYVKQDGNRGPAGFSSYAGPTGNRKGSGRGAGQKPIGPKVSSGPVTIPTISPTPVGSSPMPPALGTGNKPVIDPTKAIAPIGKKRCGPEQCQPLPPQPNPGGGNNTGQQSGQGSGGEDYRSFVQITSQSGSGHGKRKWGSVYSGYYSSSGSAGGSDGSGGIRQSGLAGAVTWSDNGSTKTFTTTVQISKKGTFYIHAYQCGKGSFTSTTLNVSGASNVSGGGTPKYIGKDWRSLNGQSGTVTSFTAEAGDTVVISGTSRGGGNHWHSVAYHLSADQTKVTTVSPYVGPQTGSQQTPGKKNIPGQIEFIHESTRSSKVNDDWYFSPAGSGTIEIVFDMYSGADGFKIYQGGQKGAENHMIADSTPSYLRKASQAEKDDLISRAGNQSVGAGNRYGGYVSSLRDYKTAPNNMVKDCGVLTFHFDASKGNFLRVHVVKPSSVYRYVIKFPKEVPPTTPPVGNPVPAQPCNVPIYNPNGPSGNAAPGMNQIHTSPVYTPAGAPSGTGSGNGGGASFRSRMARGGGSHSRNTYVYHQNYSGFGKPLSSGYTMVPSIFKKKVKVSMSSQYGKYIPLTGSQFVNTTVQRASGGKILPLAQPLTKVNPSRPQSIRAVDLVTYPFYKTFYGPGSLGFSRTDGTVLYSPRKISDLVNLPGGSISNIFTDKLEDQSYELQPLLDLVLDYPGINVLPNPTDDTIVTNPPFDVPDEDAPVQDGIVFNDSPTITIQPKVKDELGDFAPAGPPAICELAQPTPSVTIDKEDLTGVEAGDELIINNKKIIFSGSDPKVIENNLKCSQGNGFTVRDTKVNGKPALRISSCNNAPITIRDGCKGGMYKEVLDFHVVRGFEQSITDTSNTAVLPATTGFAAYNGTSVSTTTPTATYTLYNAVGDSTGTFSGAGGSPSTTKGAVLSSRTTTTTTGGSGYVVGDRLRLVGGTPIADPYGSITEICIDSKGANYTDASNVRIVIGDGTTPGSGATTGNVILNEEGGIESVKIINPGSGYDMTAPPIVRVIDLGQNYAVIGARLTAKVGAGEGLPPRVAKFVVTSVDSNGTITSLQVIDRGIYKIFPSDLTMGVPLEYDIINLGDETGVDENGDFFQGTGLGQYNPLNDNEELGSPGGYDPINNLIGGGEGARVFLTAREIPDCSEKGDVRNQLGLPEFAIDLDIPGEIAACMNSALDRAGYDDRDIFLDVEPLTPDVGLLKISVPGYDGIQLDELTPGFLDKLGLPIGDYNIDMLCMEASVDQKDSDVSRDKVTDLKTPIDRDGFGLESTTNNPTINIKCIDNIGGFNSGDTWDPTNSNGLGAKGQDPNSILGSFSEPEGDSVVFYADLFQYELRTPQGGPVNSPDYQQECEVLYLESARYSSADSSNATINGLGNAWVDSYDKTNTSISMPDFVDNGWAYLENGTPKYWQTPLVDSEFVHSALLYDNLTGEREFTLNFWDPFKGIIPGFLDSEITFRGQNDPVVYNSERANFGSKDVGKVWWDTSTIRYTWYEQGSARERWLNWGRPFPGSGITLYEWVESKTLPINYTGTGTPKNTDQYLIERKQNYATGGYENCYYFWVQNKQELTTDVQQNLSRQYDTLTVAKYLADPVGYGLPMISFIKDDSMVLSNLSPILREDLQNLQINLSRNLNPVGEKHVAWKLLREDDNNSYIPEDLTNKLIDSLCGYDAVGNSVPDSRLSEVEKYGVSFRPRQTMFGNLSEARRVFVNSLNNILADTQLESNYKGWNETLGSTRNYIETVNWFAVQRIDQRTKNSIRYDKTFKPVYKVNSVDELYSLKDIPDGSIAQVKGSDADRFRLYKYLAPTKTYELIAIENETIKIKDTLFTEANNIRIADELRQLLNDLVKNVFVNNTHWNNLFFDMMKHAYGEQGQLSWAYKTSYIYVEKDETDLIQVKNFSYDNFNQVLEYLDEVKPYTAKIREYKDGKSPAIEQMGGISDYDKPAYADADTGNVRILDDFVQADSNIIQSNNNYVKYYSQSTDASGNSVIRKGKTTINFDRTHWTLTASDYNPMTETSNVAIARQVTYLINSSNAEVSANTTVRAADRIFKFDTSVQSTLSTDLDVYFNTSDVISNTSIITTANIELAVESGALSNTFALVKDKVGANFQGEDLHGNIFGVGSAPENDISTYISTYGYNNLGWDTSDFGYTLDVENYVGSFTADSTLSRSGTAYEGFDGVTFKRMLYGEDRPEELVMISPLETFIMKVTTNANALYSNGTVIADGSVFAGNPLDGNNKNTNPLDGSNIVYPYDEANASTVSYQQTFDAEGNTEYLRLLNNGTANTSLSANLYTYSSDISVANASVLPLPTNNFAGVVWIGTERIEYTERNTLTNKLSGITRGTKGTTIENWLTTDNIIVTSGASSQTFANLNVTSKVFIDSTAVSLADSSNADVGNSSSIMKFIHNL